MIDYQSLKSIALSNVIEMPEDYFYRMICRWFSKNYSTPIKEVMEMDPNFVVLNFFEAKFEEMDEEELAIQIQRAVDPNFDENEEKSIQEFIKAVEEEYAQKRNNNTNSKNTQNNLSSSSNSSSDANHLFSQNNSTTILPKKVEKRFDINDDEYEEEREEEGEEDNGDNDNEE